MTTKPKLGRKKQAFSFKVLVFAILKFLWAIIKIQFKVLGALISAVLLLFELIGGVIVLLLGAAVFLFVVYVIGAAWRGGL